MKYEIAVYKLGYNRGPCLKTGADL